MSVTEQTNLYSFVPIENRLYMKNLNISFWGTYLKNF